MKPFSFSFECGSWRLPLAALMAFSAVTPLAWAEDAEFPYPAVVTSKAMARCGPGAHYYETSRLPAGSRVEVYRRQGGWLGIRPPKESFSWVTASQLQTTATDDVMVARQDGVRVWVGTSLAQLNKHHFQVELDEGDAVEVLGQKQLVAPSGDVADTWYKISPPSGEFRWIPESSAKRDEGVAFETSPINAPKAPPLTEPAQFERLSDQGPPPLRDVPTTPVRPAASDAGSSKALSQSPPPPTRPADPAWLAWQAPRDPVEFDQVLETFNTQLARMVARPTAEWNLTELRIKSAKLADSGPSALHRGKARKLQSQIADFQAVAQKLVDASKTPPSGANTGNLATSGSEKYAGEGWLMPVHSSKSNVPKFAVVDDNGRFLKFVSPGPGVNLRRYEKTRVGVVGPSSYIPALDMPHVTAQRIVKLR